MSKLDALSAPHFAYGRYELSPEGEVKVRNAAIFLNKYPNRYVEVNGFTDSMGTDEYNLWLSDRRANAVKDALVRYGVNPGRITARGYGNANPVASDATAEGRAQNRRVEIVLD